MWRGKSRARWVQLTAGVIMVLLSGCTGDATSETTTSTSGILAQPSTTAPPEASDVELIVDLWQRQTTSWVGGFDAGVEFWVDNNYPEMNCTFSDYMSSRFPTGPVEGLIVERIADPDSVERDDGWTIPGGSLEGEVAQGRVYKVSVESRRFEAGEPTPEPETLELHVTIIEGEPYFFLGCS